MDKQSRQVPEDRPEKESEAPPASGGRGAASGLQPGGTVPGGGPGQGVGSIGSTGGAQP